MSDALPDLANWTTAKPISGNAHATTIATTLASKEFIFTEQCYSLELSSGFAGAEWPSQRSLKWFMVATSIRPVPGCEVESVTDKSLTGRRVADNPHLPRDQQPFSFRDWQAVLSRSSLPPPTRDALQGQILRFLHACKQAHAPATVAFAKAYLAQHEHGANPGHDSAARTALRWFFSRGRYRGPFDALLADHSAASPRVRTASRPMEPLPAAMDRGGADWERDLIAAVRTRGFLWRTEQTYRDWAGRFARFLAPRSPYSAEAPDVGAFLTQLAVEHRASRNTQKQALNALVFFLQEALKRQLGQIPFQRADHGRTVPTVLTREEIAVLFNQLTGTTRLMAELAYGSGLRLLELLRLRVQHVDLPRHQLQVYAGKGAKHRVTVLPAKLVPALEHHIRRLKGLWADDRAAGLPGVWLPEGLDKKYTRAGESFEWQWLCCSIAALKGPRSLTPALRSGASP